ENISAPTGELTMGDFHFPLEQIDALKFGSFEERERLQFDAKLKTLGASVTAAGALTHAYSTAPGVSLALTFENGGGMIGLLPPPVSTWLSGQPRGTLKVAGPFANIDIPGSIRE